MTPSGLRFLGDSKHTLALTSLWSPIYSPFPTSRPPQVLHQHVSVSADITVNQPESAEAPRTCSTPPEVFLFVSLYGVQTIGAQQRM